MLKRVARMFRPNLPRSRLDLYDYERVDHLNPHKVIGDEYVLDDGEPTFNRITLWLLVYFVVGNVGYVAGRLAYDYEWDRYYHVYFPASMEYFDVLSYHYITALKRLKASLPKEYAEFFPRTEQTPVAKRTSEIPRVQVEEMLTQETEVGKAFSALFTSAKK